YKSWSKAALALSVFLFVFFIYGSVSKLLPDILFEISGIVIGPDKVVFPIVAILLGVFFWKWYKSTYNGSSLVYYLIIISAILVLFTLGQIVPVELDKTRNSSSIANASTENIMTESDSAKVVNKPDVYLLVFDRYAANNILQDSYGYDNSEFTEWLESEGF